MNETLSFCLDLEEIGIEEIETHFVALEIFKLFLDNFLNNDNKRRLLLSFYRTVLLIYFTSLQKLHFHHQNLILQHQDTTELVSLQFGQYHDQQ